MLSWLLTSLWNTKTTARKPDYLQPLTPTPWPATARAARVEGSTEGLSTTVPTLTEVEVQRDLNRVFLTYSNIDDFHRALFARYLALPVLLRDKVSANLMGFMDSLEGIAEKLMSADSRLNAEEVYVDFPVRDLSDEELWETHMDIKEVAEDMQYLRSRANRVRKTIERLEMDGTNATTISSDAVQQS